MSQPPRHRLPVGITGNTRVFALVGHPVRHSLSPQMHTELLEEYGINGVYVAFDVHPKNADEVASAVRILGLSGINLTVPFKERILPFLDHMTLAAKEAGAVNVVVNVEGTLTGYNTDGEGFLRSIEDEHGLGAEGQHCLILGAGGAARAIASSLAAAGATTIGILNRTVARAESAIDHLQPIHTKCAFFAGTLEAETFKNHAPDTTLVINCLGAGAESAVASFDINRLPASAVWNDINYWMPHPPQLEACRQRGLRVTNGLGMLAHQGALSFELFTGLPVDAARVHAILAQAQGLP